MNDSRPQDPEATVNGEDFGFQIDGAEAERTALHMDELLHQLTMQFRGYPGCEKVGVVGVTRLDAPDTSGCNWSSSIVLDPAGTPAEVYAPVWAEVIAATRATWNLK